jgi:hypothetical protein
MQITEAKSSEKETEPQITEVKEKDQVSEMIDVENTQ